MSKCCVHWRVAEPVLSCMLPTVFCCVFAEPVLSCVCVRTCVCVLLALFGDMGMCFKSMKSGARKEPKQFGTEGVPGFKSVFVSVCRHAHKL